MRFVTYKQLKGRAHHVVRIVGFILALSIQIYYGVSIERAMGPETGNVFVEV